MTDKQYLQKQLDIAAARCQRAEAHSRAVEAKMISLKIQLERLDTAYKDAEAELAKYKLKWQTGKPQQYGRYLCEGYYFNMDSNQPYQFLCEWFAGEWNSRLIARWAGPILPPEE